MLTHSSVPWRIDSLNKLRCRTSSQRNADEQEMPSCYSHACTTSMNGTACRAMFETLQAAAVVQLRISFHSHRFGLSGFASQLRTDLALYRKQKYQKHENTRKRCSKTALPAESGDSVPNHANRWLCECHYSSWQDRGCNNMASPALWHSSVMIQ